MVSVRRGIHFLGLLALLTSLPQGVFADVAGGGGSSPMALGRVEGQVACARPGVPCRSVAFAMPVLHPMRILEVACVDGKGRRAVPTKAEEGGSSVERCADSVHQALWYRLEMEPRKSGWVPAEHVWVWESRHALMSSTDGSHRAVPGYCDVDQAEQVLRGQDAPCAALWRKELWFEGRPMLLPVLDIRELGDGIEFDRRIYLKVLAPMPCGSAQDVHAEDSDAVMLQDQTPAVESLGPGEWDVSRGAPVPGRRMASCIPTDRERRLGAGRMPRDGRPMVVRELWVPQSSGLVSTAVLTPVEARELARGLHGLARAIEKEGHCASLDRDRWRAVFRAVPPAGPWMDAMGAFDPAVSPGGRSLHDYWRLALSRGDSVVFQPFDEVKGASPERCAAVRERVGKAGSSVEQALSRHSKQPFVWVSFSQLP